MTGRGFEVAMAASRHPIAGPHARSTQNRLRFVQVAPSSQINTSTGTAAASAYQDQGCDRMRSLAVTMPAARTPTANSTARSGVNFSRASFSSATCGPRTPITITIAATSATIARALTRRTISSSKGSRMYSWASMAIDQKARLGLPAGTASCTSRP
jgi:hypothetical protein